MNPTCVGAPHEGPPTRSVGSARVRRHERSPAIVPVDADIPDRPLWSVVIPIHNAAHLLAESLGSVVSQLGDRPDAEIIVVDDGSDDDPASVCEAVGGGRVVVHRNPTAVGAVHNFNVCLGHTSGRWIHLLHGDDRVQPGFYAAMERSMGHVGVVAAVCRTQQIDDQGAPLGPTRSERKGTGAWSGALETIAISNRVRPAAVVVARSAYEESGGYREDLPHAADWEMWARLAAQGTIWFVDEILACYRRHDGSDTAARVRTGANIRERLVAARIINDYLPADARIPALRRSNGYSSVFAARTALRCARTHDWRAAAAQLRDAARCLFAVIAPSRT